MYHHHPTQIQELESAWIYEDLSIDSKYYDIWDPWSIEYIMNNKVVAHYVTDRFAASIIYKDGRFYCELSRHWLYPSQFDFETMDEIYGACNNYY